VPSRPEQDLWVWSLVWVIAAVAAVASMQGVTFREETVIITFSGALYRLMRAMMTLKVMKPTKKARKTSREAVVGEVPPRDTMTVLCMTLLMTTATTMTATIIAMTSIMTATYTRKMTLKTLVLQGKEEKLLAK
jgi:cobalamin synthase